MSGELERAALVYAGMAWSFALVHRLQPEARLWQAAARGGWCAAFSVVASIVALRTASGAWPRVELVEALGPGVWVFALALSAGRERAWGVLGAAGVAVEGGLRGGLALGVAVVAAEGFGLAVAACMATRRHLLFRVLSHWVSFVGTFAVLGPLAVRDFGRSAPAPLELERWPWVVLLVAVASALAGASTVAFADAGGTPEPLDHPSRLATSGIYAWLRHPIQLAEICFVAAGAVLVGAIPAACWAACFALALLGPVRFWEERRLAARFGAEFEAYRRRVPAYLPLTLRGAYFKAGLPRSPRA